MAVGAQEQGDLRVNRQLQAFAQSGSVEQADIDLLDPVAHVGALQRGVQGSRNSNRQMKYAEGYQRIFPQVAEVLQ